VSELERWTVFIDTFARAFDVEDGVSPYAGASSTDGSRAVEVVPADQLAATESERDDLQAENERLREALAHVINRVSTERRDDEHGHIFAVGKAALVRTNDDVPSVPELVERSRALGPVMEAQGERVAQGLREAADRMRGGE
jgi:hypothetical protein